MWHRHSCLCAGYFAATFFVSVAAPTVSAFTSDALVPGVNLPSRSFPFAILAKPVQWLSGGRELSVSIRIVGSEYVGPALQYDTVPNRWGTPASARRGCSSGRIFPTG